MDQEIDETYRVDKSGLIASIETALLHPAVKMLVGGAIFAIAILVLHRLAVDVSWTAVQADIAALPLSNLLLALVFTATSFMALAAYDVLAVHSVAPGRVPVRVAATAGAAGYAISNLLGFSWLTGAAVRARIYDTYDMDMAAVGNVVATLWFSFWLGVAILTGLLLTFHPAGLGPTLNFSAPIESAMGIGLLIGFALLIGWLATGKRSVGLKGFVIRLPGAQMALAQTAVAVFDIVSAALTMYVLLPPDLAQNFAFFFVIFVAAIGLGIVSHSPGGIGVFEATMIAGLGAAGRSDMLASLVLYRLVYYVIPFCVAVCGLALAWLLRSPEKQARAGRKIYSIVKPLIHAASAGIALMAGLTLLVSGSLPAEFGRITALQDLSVLSLVEASHLVGSIAGVLLIIIARGLYRKQAKAWWIAMVLIGIGALATIAKGAGWLQAEVLLVALVLLGTFRSAFYRGAAPDRVSSELALADRLGDGRDGNDLDRALCLFQCAVFQQSVVGFRLARRCIAVPSRLAGHGRHPAGRSTQFMDQRFGSAPQAGTGSRPGARSGGGLAGGGSRPGADRRQALSGVGKRQGLHRLCRWRRHADLKGRPGGRSQGGGRPLLGIARAGRRERQEMRLLRHLGKIHADLCGDGLLDPQDRRGGAGQSGRADAGRPGQGRFPPGAQQGQARGLRVRHHTGPGGQEASG